MQLFRHTYRLLGIYSLITLMSGCSWTPQVETAIYEDPQLSVSLITVTEESFEADHPVTLQADTIIHILNGLHLHQNTRLLQKLFSSGNSSRAVFTKEQSTILAPHIQKAFSQITPEEHVAFQTQGSNETQESQAIHGTMYVKGEDLYVSLTFASPGAHAATKTASRNVRPDQEGSGKPIVAFKPKEALRGEKKTHWLFGGEENNHIVINVPFLASFYRQQTTQEDQAAQENPQNLQSSPKAEETLPRKANAPLLQKSVPQPQTTEETLENSETQTLLEEIRELRKELGDQKKAIDQLRQEKQKTR